MKNIINIIKKDWDNDGITFVLINLFLYCIFLPIMIGITSLLPGYAIYKFLIWILK